MRIALIKAVALGLFLGTLVAADPLLTDYLQRDLSFLRDLPFFLSLTVALAVGIAYVTRAIAPNLFAAVIRDSYRYFPLVFLLAYQFTGVRAGPLDPTDSVIVVFMGLLLAEAFIHQDQHLVDTPMYMLSLLLVICIVLSLASQFRIFTFAKSLKPLIVFFLMVNCLSREDVFETFLRWLYILAMVSACFCLVQEVTWITSQNVLSLVPQDQLMRMFEHTSLGPFFRVPGMMIAYRSMALYLASALMFSVSSLLWPRTEKPLFPRRWLIFGLFLIVPALVLTFAHDIYVGSVLGILLLFVLHKRRRLLTFSIGGLVGVLAILIATAIVPGGVNRMIGYTRTIPKEKVERIRLDRDSIEGFLRGPYMWTGRGIGSGYRYTDSSTRWPAHNAFILVAAELGIAGLAVYLMIYGLIFSRAIALNLLVTTGPYLSIVRALLALQLVVFIGAQFQASYLDIFEFTIFATIEAVWFRLRRLPSSAPDTGTGAGLPEASAS